MASEPPTPKPSSQKPSTLWGFMRGLGIGAILVLGIIGLYLCLFWLANRPDPIIDHCSFPPEFSCRAWAIDIEADRIQITIENKLGEDIIVKGMVLTKQSSPPFHRCEMISEEVPIPNGASASIIMNNCSVYELPPGYRYRYDMEVTYHHVSDGEEYVATGDLSTAATEWSAT